MKLASRIIFVYLIFYYLLSFVSYFLFNYLFAILFGSYDGGLGLFIISGFLQLPVLLFIPSLLTWSYFVRKREAISDEERLKAKKLLIYAPFVMMLLNFVFNNIKLILID